MTTSIFDVYNELTVSDTRWSMQCTLSDGNEYVVFCDETGFEKIANREHIAIMTAGSGLRIAEWKRWLLFSDLDENNMPNVGTEGVDAVHLILIDTKMNAPLFDYGLKHVLIDQETKKIACVMLGSGSQYASSYWNLTRCPFRSIATASKNDIYTSKTTRYIDFNTLDTDIDSHACDFNVVIDKLKQEAKMQVISSSQPTQLSQHPLKHEVLSMLNNGTAQVIAPTMNSDKVKWSDSEKQRLKGAIVAMRESLGMPKPN